MRIETLLTNWDKACLGYDSAKEREVDATALGDDAIDLALAATATAFTAMLNTLAPDLAAVARKLRAAMIEHIDGVPAWCIVLTLGDLEKLAG